MRHFTQVQLSHEPDDAQLVTMKLESGNFLCFQVDTGAQCNVVPVDLYRSAAQNPNLKKVTKSSRKIVAYRGSTISVVEVSYSSAGEKQNIGSSANWSKETRYGHSSDGKPA